MTYPKFAYRVIFGIFECSYRVQEQKLTQKRVKKIYPKNFDFWPIMGIEVRAQGLLQNDENSWILEIFSKWPENSYLGHFWLIKTFKTSEKSFEALFRVISKIFILGNFWWVGTLKPKNSDFEAPLQQKPKFQNS